MQLEVKGAVTLPGSVFDELFSLSPAPFSSSHHCCQKLHFRLNQLSGLFPRVHQSCLDVNLQSIEADAGTQERFSYNEAHNCAGVAAEESLSFTQTRF